MKKPFDKVIDPKQLRLKLGMNQAKFWGAVGVTQSGGSRYENQRRIPKPVAELVRLVHVNRIDLRKINKTDMKVAELLKIHQPDLYKNLKKAIQSL